MLLTAMLLTTDPSPWLAVFGRFHLVLLHLPIGLLPGILLLEFGAALFRRPPPRGAVLTLAVLTALVAGAALASGLVLAGEKVDTELLGQHKNFAIAMTALCGLLPLLAALRDRRAFRVVLVLACISSVPTGHLGGTLVHKRDFLFKPLERQTVPVPPKEPQLIVLDAVDAGGPATNQAAGQAPGQSPGQGDTVPEGPIAADPQLSAYDRNIVPILERVCIDCHNPDKEKGDLLLTDKQWLARGEEDRILVPGDPDSSLMVELCELPIDDEDHMPPADEPQPTKAELQTIRRWIADGAKH